jgi:hypothetical protein
MSKVAKKTEATTEVAVETKMVPFLCIKSVPVVRPGTAAEAALSAILCNEGKDRATVLEALKSAETAWHKDAGRVVKAVAPAGWLRKWDDFFYFK